MKTTFRTAALAASLLATPALSASSEWIEAQGGKLRIITKDKAHEGTLHGALEIQLQPGWKTYWRDPGESGVPPQIGIEGSQGITAVTIDYPVPEWVDDGYSTYAAYKRSVMLPLTFITTKNGVAGDIAVKAQVFAGICEKICIPVSGELEIKPGVGEVADDLVDQAFALLPGEAKAGFRIAAITLGEDRLDVTAELPANAEDARLFVAGGGGWYLGAAKPDGKGGFTVPVFDRPANDSASEPQQLFYTLATTAGAVSGFADLAGE